jgi:hypothetical protein
LFFFSFFYFAFGLVATQIQFSRWVALSPMRRVFEAFYGRIRITSGFGGCEAVAIIAILAWFLP